MSAYLKKGYTNAIECLTTEDREVVEAYVEYLTTTDKKQVLTPDVVGLSVVTTACTVIIIAIVLTMGSCNEEARIEAQHKLYETEQQLEATEERLMECYAAKGVPSV